jgi:PAS domain S-box-containing protein
MNCWPAFKSTWNWRHSVPISNGILSAQSGPSRGQRRLEEELAERRRMDQALSESEERFRTLADRAPVGIWVTGPDDRLTFYNKRALTFVGHNMPLLSDAGWRAVVHPDDLEGVQAKYLAAVQAGRSFRIECRVRRASGQYRWILHTGLPRFVNGGYSGHIGTSIDITDLRRSHERATAAQKL